MTRYHVDSEKMKSLFARAGYKSLAEFARAHGFNRATIHNYLKGLGPFPQVYYSICDALSADPISILSPVTGSKIDDVSEIMPIVRTIAAHEEGIAAGIFGSRAKGTHRKYSDWDLGITRGARPLGGEEFLRLRRSLVDAIDVLPRRVDFINLDAAPEWFLGDIDYEPIFLTGDSNSWAYFMGVIHGTKRGKKVRKGALRS